MKTKFCVLFFIISIKSFAQVQFEKGYFINNSNQKIECLIKNQDWLQNPLKFEYKLDNDSKILFGDISSVKEFEIYNWSKFIKATVNIDKSSDDIDFLTHSRMPDFEEKTVFLKFLLEGKANLYSYSDGSKKKFFFNVDDNKIEPLIFKYFYSNDNGSERFVNENVQYKQQILNNLVCSTIKKRDIERMKYQVDDLVKIFTLYNNCNVTSENNSLALKNYAEKEKRDFLNLSFRMRLNRNSLRIKSSYDPEFSLANITFENKTTIGLGVELEYVLPFNKNKWAFVIEPNYMSYNSEITTNLTNNDEITCVAKYSAMRIATGVRYYMFLNKNSKIYANIIYSPIFDFNSSIVYRKNNRDLNHLEIKSDASNGLGIGYKYKNKFSVELRTYSSRNILSSYQTRDSDFKETALVLGYSFF